MPEGDFEPTDLRLAPELLDEPAVLAEPVVSVVPATSFSVFAPSSSSSNQLSGFIALAASTTESPTESIVLQAPSIDAIAATMHMRAHRPIAERLPFSVSITFTSANSIGRFALSYGTPKISYQCMTSHLQWCMTSKN